MKMPPKLSEDAIKYLVSYMQANSITSDDFDEWSLGGAGGATQPNSGIGNAETEDNAEADTDVGNTLTISPTSETITSIISQFASQAAASVSQSAAHLAKSSFTVSDYTYAFVQAGLIEKQVQVGGAFSYDFSTTELDSENFISLSGDSSSMPRKGMMPGASGGAGMGVTIGIGNVDGSNGASGTLSVSFKRVGVAVTWNQDYIGVSLNVGVSVGPATIALSESVTKPIGQMSRRNLGQELENMQHNLFDFSGDYLNH